MTQIQAMISGIYPRSAALVQATRDHDRGRIDGEQLARKLAADRQALVALQREAGCDALSDGLLNWQDLFRPLVEASEGVRPGALVRTFNTNTFHRQPVFERSPRLDPEALGPYFERGTGPEPWRATLPGPATLFELSSGPARSPEAVVALLEGALDWLAARGYAWLQFQEPWLAYHSQRLAPAQLEAHAAALGALARRAQAASLRVGVHLPFGDAAPLAAALAGQGLDFVGVDFYHTDLEALGGVDWSQRALLAGCVNGRNSLVEDERVLREFVDRLLTALAPRALILSNTVDLEHVPEPIARRKVERLGQVKRSFAGSPKE